MYHITRKPSTEVHPAPPISSIPLIGLQPEDPNANTQLRTYGKFRSTDTPLVRLQKMGGRRDLLCFRENEPRKDPPKETSVCEPQDHANDKSPCHDYVFKVPAYMLHMPCKPKPSEPLITPKIVSSPCPTLPKTRAIRMKKTRGKPWNLPSSRPGYSEYNKILPPATFVRKEYFYPNVTRYVRVS